MTRYPIPRLLLVCSALLLLLTANAAKAAEAEDAAATVAPAVEGLDGTFVLHDVGKKSDVVRYNPKLAAQRLSPYSTFKIWNTLIGLDTGVISGLDFRLDWDQEKYPPEAFWPESWKRGHDLTSAFQNSVVWYYREVASRVGAGQMGWMLRRIGYGNADISGGIDRFWLNSTLQISPDEQVELLTRLVRGEVPFTQRDLDILRTIMTVGGKPGVYVLRGKTGAGPAPNRDGVIGWFVGYLEKPDNTYTFATLLRGADYPSILDKRIPVTQDALKRLGLIEE